MEMVVLEPVTYAYLETTNYCNLDCSFCNRPNVIGPLKHMSINNWAKVLDKIKDYPLKEAKLMGMGEPLLHPEFDKITSMFKQEFPDCFVIVATNCQYSLKSGSKMRQKFIDSLKNIDMIYFSIDGYKEHYERDRAPAKWSKLIQFLDDFKDMDRQGCNVVVNYVVNKYNVYDIPKIEELIEEYDLGELRINIAQIWDPEISIKSNDKIWGYSDEQLDYLSKNYLGNIKGRTPWSWNDCFWVKNGLYMTVEGNVKVCCMNTAAEPIGNIFNNSLEKIRNSDAYNNIKTGCEKNAPTNHCKNCSYKELSPLLQKLGVSG
jgi:radical SAM protein with 4Fe4S-binding SPASM domain